MSMCDYVDYADYVDYIDYADYVDNTDNADNTDNFDSYNPCIRKGKYTIIQKQIQTQMQMQMQMQNQQKEKQQKQQKMQKMQKKQKKPQKKYVPKIQKMNLVRSKNHKIINNDIIINDLLGIVKTDNIVQQQQQQQLTSDYKHLYTERPSVIIEYIDQYDSFQNNIEDEYASHRYYDYYRDRDFELWRPSTWADIYRN